MPPSSHARFFCARPDGTLTPLVALDDFPPGVMIRDLPRNLGAGDTQGMTSCGLASPRAKPLDIGGVAHVYPSVPGSHDIEELHKTLVLILHDSKAPSHIRTLVQNTLCRVVEQSVGLASEMTNTTPPGFVHAGKVHSPATSGPSVSAQSGRAVSLKYPLDISLFRLLTLHILGSITLPADRPTRRSSVRTGFVTASVTTVNKASDIEKNELRTRLTILHRLYVQARDAIGRRQCGSTWSAGHTKMVPRQIPSAEHHG